MTRLNKAAGKILFEDTLEIIEEYLKEPPRGNFFKLPHHIFRIIKSMAISDAIYSYKPYLSVEDAYVGNLHVYYMLFIFIGFKIYTNERILRTEGREYSFIEDEEDLNSIYKSLTEYLFDLKAPLYITSSADYAITLASEKAEERAGFEMFDDIKGHKLSMKNLRGMRRFVFLRGYCLAHEVIFPQIPIEPNWPKRVMKGI